MRCMIDCACPFNLPLASGDSGLRATVTYPEELLQRRQFCDHNQSYLSPSAGDPRPREADCAPHGQREKACRMSSGAEQQVGLLRMRAERAKSRLNPYAYTWAIQRLNASMCGMLHTYLYAASRYPQMYVLPEPSVVHACSTRVPPMGTP